ncbi:hypothetical protein [Thermofilum sp.]
MDLFEEGNLPGLLTSVAENIFGMRGISGGKVRRSLLVEKVPGTL